MKFKVCILIITLACVGCGTSSLVTPNGRNDINLSPSELNDKIGNKSVTIFFKDSTITQGKEFRVENDSASWKEVESGNIFKAPLSRINSVTTHSNRLVGGIIGFGSGLVVGSLVGLGLSSGSSEGGMNFFTPRRVTLFFGSTGAFIGTAVGVNLTRTREYLFNVSASKK